MKMYNVPTLSLICEIKLYPRFVKQLIGTFPSKRDDLKSDVNLTGGKLDMLHF